MDRAFATLATRERDLCAGFFMKQWRDCCNNGVIRELKVTMNMYRQCGHGKRKMEMVEKLLSIHARQQLELDGQYDYQTLCALASWPLKESAGQWCKNTQ